MRMAIVSHDAFLATLKHDSVALTNTQESIVRRRFPGGVTLAGPESVWITLARRMTVEEKWAFFEPNVYNYVQQFLSRKERVTLTNLF